MVKKPDKRIADLTQEVVKHIPVAKQLWFVLSREFIEVFSTHEKSDGQGEMRLTTSIGYEDFGKDRYYHSNFHFNNNDEIFTELRFDSNGTKGIPAMYSQAIKEFEETVKEQPINSSVNCSKFINDFVEALTDLYTQSKSGAYIVDLVPNKTNSFQVSVSLHLGNRQYERVGHQVDIFNNIMTVIPLTHVGNTGMKFQYTSVKELVQDFEQLYHRPIPR